MRRPEIAPFFSAAGATPNENPPAAEEGCAAPKLLPKPGPDGCCGVDPKPEKGEGLGCWLSNIPPPLGGGWDPKANIPPAAAPPPPLPPNTLAEPNCDGAAAPAPPNANGSAIEEDDDPNTEAGAEDPKVGCPPNGLGVEDTPKGEGVVVGAADEPNTAIPAAAGAPKTELAALPLSPLELSAAPNMNIPPAGVVVLRTGAMATGAKPVAKGALSVGPPPKPKLPVGVCPPKLKVDESVVALLSACTILSPESIAESPSVVDPEPKVYANEAAAGEGVSLESSTNSRNAVRLGVLSWTKDSVAEARGGAVAAFLASPLSSSGLVVSGLAVKLKEVDGFQAPIVNDEVRNVGATSVFLASSVEGFSFSSGFGFCWSSLATTTTGLSGDLLSSLAFGSVSLAVAFSSGFSF